MSEAAWDAAQADAGGFARLPGPARVAVILGVAAVVGLGSTALSIATGTGFGLLKAGPWESRPRTGALDADPYTRASIARSGAIPLGLGEGVAFTARRDSDGAPLVSSCTYRVSGRVPSARAWTLAVEDRRGRVMDNPAHRYAVTSSEVVRNGEGRVTVAVSRDAQPGNWLPVGDDSRFELVLRLYDTPVGGGAAALDPAAMPAILRTGCP